MKTFIKNGIEVGREIISDKTEINQFLNHCFRPPALKQIKNQLRTTEEMFFSFVGGREQEYPLVRLFLFHLDSRKRHQSHCFIIHVHKDHLSTAEEMAKILKSKIKNENDWQETTRYEMGLVTNFLRLKTREMY
jgi:hypothetical protein